MKAKLAVVSLVLAVLGAPGLAKADTVTDWNRTLVAGLEAGKNLRAGFWIVCGHHAVIRAGIQVIAVDQRRRHVSPAALHAPRDVLV